VKSLLICTVDELSKGRKHRPRQETRKELRKAARGEKKAARHGPPPAKRTKVQHTRNVEDNGTHSDEGPLLRSGPLLPAPDKSSKPKSILKATRNTDSDATKPGKPLLESLPARISRSVKKKLDEDDEEIAALEKKLGLKGKKSLPQSFKDDGLDELLEGLDDGLDSDILDKKSKKAEGDEWLEKKRREARNQAKRKSAVVEEGEDSDDDGSLDDDDNLDQGAVSDISLDGPDFPDDVSQDDESDLEVEELGSDEDTDFDNFDSSQKDDSDQQSSKRLRENPYVAPNTGAEVPNGKYIPPSLRKSTTLESGDMLRLRRRTQGLVNRLTEANLISILGDIEGLYRDNPRQHVTSILVDILLTSICEPTSLPDTLIILPAGFIAAVYKIIGTDFGAQVVQRIVELFDEHYARANARSQDGPQAATSDISKESSNIIMLLSEMYNFQVVGSNLIFDYVKMFLEKLSELNAELLLKIIRASGPQLRQDDSSSLKDIVSMLHPAVMNAGGESNISVRTKFMIETITDLRNNKVKTGGVVSAVTSEHTIRMKKIIGSLNNRAIKGSEPLRIGLKDIRESDKKGKWWLVGASWAGNATEEGESTTSVTFSVEDPGSVDLLQLAREQRMNTDVRRAIFVAIMSATDFQDAYLRLMKLRLKRVQEYEIPKVLIHCAGGENTYNPYYTLISKKICSDKRLRTAFQFCLWDLFKKMGESDDEDDIAEDDEGSLDTRKIVNLAKMFGALVLEGGLGLIILKNLNLSYLQEKTKTFLEVMFVALLLQSQRQSGTNRDEGAVVKIFTKIGDTPQLIRGLQYFMKKVVSKTDIAGGKEDKETIKWACKVARDTLDVLAK
jgi:nucleolar MIF4G domain-containing protein 1